jgi:hypothetical protein
MIKAFLINFDQSNIVDILWFCHEKKNGSIHGLDMNFKIEIKLSKIAVLKMPPSWIFWKPLFHKIFIWFKIIKCKIMNSIIWTAGLQNPQIQKINWKLASYDKKTDVGPPSWNEPPYLACMIKFGHWLCWSWK